MKHQLFARILVGFALAIGATATISQPTTAASNRYTCDIRNGIPTTLAHIPSKGRVSLIHWVSSWTPQTPLQRCQEISKRFQTFSDNRLLKYIKTGQVNSLPVLCVASTKNSRCQENMVLVTLEPGSNPHETLSQILDFRGLVEKGGVYLGGDLVSYDENGDASVDVEQLLEVAPVKN